MIIYSLTYHIDKAIAEEWLEWVKGVQIPRIMDSGFFLRHTLQELVEPIPYPDSRTFNLQLFAEQVEAVNSFLKEEAEILLGAHDQRFADHFTAFDTLMRRLD
jgi:hypothetical protein